MKEKQVYLIAFPLGEIEAVAIRKVAARSLFNTWLMYSQNRLFTITEDEDAYSKHYQYGIMVCDYCIIPEADDILKYSNNAIKLNLI